MKKLWNGKNIYSESCMFAGKRQAQLLFAAEKVEKIETPALGIVYEEGRDYIYSPGGKTVTLTENSRIPYISNEILYPEKDLRIYPAKNSNAIGNAVNGGYLLFNNDDYFARNQVEVTYTAKENDFPQLLDSQLSRLPKTRKRIAGNESLNVVLFGDSISQGYNSTKFTNTPPYQPCYMELVCNEIPNSCLHNFAVSGTGIQFARHIYTRLYECKADLVVIAYGMKNFASTKIENFMAELDWIIKEKSAKSYEAEFIIVTPMTGNSEWKFTVPGPDAVYADAMRKYVENSSDSIALADVQCVWKALLERKKFHDLTGNGVNHPNDFGHRVYASVLLELLGI